MKGVNKMKKLKKGRRIVTITVPIEARDSLQPYADIFETIVIPLVRNLGDEEIESFKTRKRLTDLVSNYSAEKGIREPHSVLVYYGLMLCCYYCSGYSSFLKRRSSKKLSSTLEIIAKARALIRVTYFQLQHYQKDPLFLCG